MEINAHINNISFPKTVEQLEEFIYRNGCYNVEDVIFEAQSAGYTRWTVPRSSVVGDVVLYFHAKTAIQWIRKLETEATAINSESHDREVIFEWLKRARKLYELYGGKIFAIGRIDSCPELEDDLNTYHWSGRVYADVKDLYLLENPVDISEFNTFILVSRQSAITPLPSTEYEKLKRIILAKNPKAPAYFIDGVVGSRSLTNINVSNFLEATKNYRKRFLLETNFRSYFVDYFLKTLSGKEYYRECRCYTAEHPLARVDNVFVFNGKNYLLEVKLNIALEDNLLLQLDQYINAEYIYLNERKGEKIFDFVKEYMFVVDTYAVYKYLPARRMLAKQFDLDDLVLPCDIIDEMKKSI